MATRRVLELTIDPPALVTHFRLRFRVIGATTWTNYSTASASPADAEDLAVGLLASGVYTLDGINSPAGNEGVASEAGTEYEVQHKTSGGYGNWSTAPVSIIASADDDSPLSDISRLTRDFADLKTMLDFASQEEADVFLGEALADAADELRETDEIEALYVSATRTASQTRRLTAAEVLMGKAKVFEKAMDMKATGMHAPLLMEDAETLREQAEYYRSRAMERLAGITEGGAGAASVQYLHPFSEADERIFARDTEW